MSDLRGRAAARAAGTDGAPAAGTDVARQPQAVTLGSQIRDMEKQFRMAAPRGVEAAQLVRDSLTCLRTIRSLDKCDPQSVLGSLMTCAQLGLRPGVLGHAWPLPFWDSRFEWVDPETQRVRKGGYRAQFVIGYQGLVELAYRSRMVRSVFARTAMENDLFDIDLGVADTLVHKPLLTGDRGGPAHYYAVVKLDGGGSTFFWMNYPDMLAYRDRYAPRNKAQQVTGPWASDPGSQEFDGMSHKTCFRQLSKFVPKGTDLATAIEVDGAVRVDITPDAPAHEASFHPDREPIHGEAVDVAAGAGDPGEGYDPTTDPGFGEDR